MNLPTEIFGEVIVVHTPEELNADKVDGFLVCVSALERNKVVFDLDHTEILDSAGLTALLDVQDRIGQGGGETKIATTNAANRKILEITRLDRQLEVFPSVIDAVKSFPAMTLASANTRLGDLLVQRGYLSAESLQSALERQRQGGRNRLLGEILVDGEYCTEDQIVECLASEYGVPYAKLDQRLFDPRVTDILPREYVENNLVLPLFVVRGTLTIAVPEPSNLFLIDEIRCLSGLEVQIVAATTKDIRRMITSLPNSKVFVIDDIIEDSEAADVTLIEEAIEDIGDIDEIAGQSPVIRLVNYMHLQRRQGRGQRHPHRAGRTLAAGPLPRRRPALQEPRSPPAPAAPPSPAASRSWAAWTSASGGCPRTAA